MTYWREKNIKNATKKKKRKMETRMRGSKNYFVTPVVFAFFAQCKILGLLVHINCDLL